MSRIRDWLRKSERCRRTCERVEEEKPTDVRHGVLALVGMSMTMNLHQRRTRDQAPRGDKAAGTKTGGAREFYRREVPRRLGHHDLRRAGANLEVGDASELREGAVEARVLAKRAYGRAHEAGTRAALRRGTALLGALFCAFVLTGTGCGDGGSNPDFVFRGDVNSDGIVDSADVVFLDAFLFGGGQAPVCFPAADVNHDGELSEDDSVYLDAFVNAGGPMPVDPFISNCSEGVRIE